MSGKPIRVLCVDDSNALTKALGQLIRTQPDLEDAGALPNADGLLAEVEQRKPDIVLMDLTMPGVPPLEAIRELAERAPWCRVIAYSGYSDAETVNLAIDAGAWKCISKLTEPQQILESIRLIATS